MDGVVFFAEGLGIDAFLERLGLRGRAVLVTSTDEDCRVAASAREAGENVGGEDATDDVSQVGDVVDVGETEGKGGRMSELV